MDPNSGRIQYIATDEDEADAKKRGLIPIPEESLSAVSGMNRKQRRKWAAEQRKASTKADLQGQIQELRGVCKRAHALVSHLADDPDLSDSDRDLLRRLAEIASEG